MDIDKEVLAKDDSSKEDIERATKDLSDTLSKVGEAMYKDQQSAGQPKSEEVKDKAASDKSSASQGKKDEKFEEGEVVE